MFSQLSAFAIDKLVNKMAVGTAAQMEGTVLLSKLKHEVCAVVVRGSVSVESMRGLGVDGGVSRHYIQANEGAVINPVGLIARKTAELGECVLSADVTETLSLEDKVAGKVASTTGADTSGSLFTLFQAKKA